MIQHLSSSEIPTIVKTQTNIKQALDKTESSFFYAKCPDDALANSGIYVDDLLMVHKKEALDGAIVLAVYQDELIIRRFSATESVRSLISADPEYPAVDFNSQSSPTIVGVVSFVMHPTHTN